MYREQLPQPDGARFPPILRRGYTSLLCRNTSGSNVNPLAVEVMAEIGIDISRHTPTDVNTYLDKTWDYVITVCNNAQETCPTFTGNVWKRLHIGFDDPSEAKGTAGFIRNEFIRVRNEIRNEFTKFYLTEIKEQQQ